MSEKMQPYEEVLYVTENHMSGTPLTYKIKRINIYYVCYTHRVNLWGEYSTIASSNAIESRTMAIYTIYMYNRRICKNKDEENK